MSATTFFHLPVPIAAGLLALTALPLGESMYAKYLLGTPSLPPPRYIFCR